MRMGAEQWRKNEAIQKQTNRGGYAALDMVPGIASLRAFCRAIPGKINK